MKSFKLFFIYSLFLFLFVSPSFAYENKESAVKSFITTLYENILGREPDIEGIEYWKNALYNENRTSTEVTRYFFTSKELKKQNLTDEEFIERVYKTLLGREPDREGYEYWLKLLKDKKIPRLQLFYRFVFSKEFEKLTLSHGIMPYNKKDLTIAFLERFYNLILQRDSDGFGLNYWYEKLVTKEKSPKIIAKDFFYSKEFLTRELSDEEFVEIAYRTLLNREPEDEGFKYWVDKLKNGYERDKLLDDFLDSQEFKNITERFLNKDIPILRDIYPPSFSPPKFLRVDDNQSKILELNAEDESSPITFTVSGGEDGEFFEIKDGVLYEKEPLFFKNPKDKNKDNLYELFIKAEDSEGNAIEKKITIKVCPKEVSKLACEVGIYKIGRFNWGEKSYTIFKKGDFAYLVSKYEGVYIVDVKNPKKPSFVSFLEIDDFLLDLVFYKGYLFVSGGKYGINIIDVKDVKNPKLIGKVDEERDGVKLFIYENYLFSVNDSQGIDIYDIKNPKEPSFITHIETEMALSRVFVKGDKLYVAAEEEGILIYDIKDISNPSLIRSLYLGENAKDIAVSGDFAYVAVFDEGVKKVDLKSLKVVENLKLDSKAVRVLVKDGYLFVADTYAGVKVLDISKKEMKIVGFLGGGEVNDLFIDGELLYVADGIEGLDIVDISNPVTKGVVSVVDIEKGAYKLLIGDKKAFIADFGKNLQVLDIEDPISPSLLSNSFIKESSTDEVFIKEDDISLLSSIFREEDYITDMKILNNYLFLGNGVEGVKVFDIKNLKDISKIESEIAVSSLEAKNDILYLGGSDKKLEIVDVSEINASKNIYSYDLKISPDILKLKENLLFAASVDGGLELLDIKDYKKPNFNSYFDLNSNIFDLLFYKNYLFIAGGSRGVLIYDISDKKMMNLVANISLNGYAKSLTIEEDKLFVGALYNGIFSFDLSDIKNIKTLSFFPLYGVFDIKKRDGFLYAVDFNRGFWILDEKEIEKNYYLTH